MTSIKVLSVPGGFSVPLADKRMRKAEQWIEKYKILYHNHSQNCYIKL